MVENNVLQKDTHSYEPKCRLAAQFYTGAANQADFLAQPTNNVAGDNKGKPKKINQQRYPMNVTFLLHAFNDAHATVPK